MKLTQAQLNQLFKSVGVQAVEIVADETDSDFDIEKTIEDIDNNRTQLLKPRLESELKDTVLKGEIGKMEGTFNTVLARVIGVSRSELEKIDGYDKRVEHAISHKTNQLQGDTKEVEARFNSILSEAEAEREKLRAEYEGKLSEAQSKYVQRDIQSNLASMLNGAPLPEGADRNIAANDFYSHLANKYHVSFDEQNKAIKLYDKANQTIPALKGNQTVDIMAEAKEYFTPRALWQTDMRTKNPKEELNKVTDPVKRRLDPAAANMSATERAKAERLAYLETKSD